MVTATRLPQPLKHTTISVTLITEEEIEEQQAVTVSEVLRNIPGVEVQRSGTMGEQTMVRMRGGFSAHTLVLLDGVEINSPWWGSFDFADLMIDNIERIEVVRGPQSALYGSEAMGGVINIITKKGEDKRKLSLLAEGGNQGSYREGLDINGAWKKFDYSLSFSRTDIGGQFDRDEYGNLSLCGRIGLDISDRASIELISRYIDSQKELGTYIGELITPLQVVFDQNNLLEKGLMNNTLIYDQVLFDWWECSLRGSVVKTHLKNKNPPDNAIPDFNFENIDITILDVDVQNNFYPVEWATMTAGFEYKRDEVDRYQSLYQSDQMFQMESESQLNKDRDIWGFYLQGNFDWRNTLFFNAGVRIDDYSDFGTNTNVRLSAAYLVKSTGTKLRGGWGTGFRAPDFSVLYYPPVSISFREMPIVKGLGNPNLKPEESESYELGFEQSLWGEKINFDATYFHIRFRDLIDFRQETTNQLAVFRPANIARARSRGVEIGLQIRPINNLRFRANYTYLDTEDEETGEELAGRSRNRWNFNLCYHFLERLHLNLDLNLVSSQSVGYEIIDLNGNLLGGRNPGYTKLDAALAYDLLTKSGHVKNLQLFGRIDNLFDEDYQEVRGFPAPGTLFLAGIKTTL